MKITSYLIIIFFICSCSVTSDVSVVKRKYRAGYFIDAQFFINKTVLTKDNLDNHEAKHDTLKKQKSDYQNNIFATIPYEINKNEIPVISTQENNFQQCKFTLLKTDNNVLKENNDAYKQTDSSVIVTEKPKKEIEPLSLLSFFVSISSVPFFSFIIYYVFPFIFAAVFFAVILTLISFILAINGLKRIKEDKYNYKGKFFAIAGICFCFLSLLIMSFIIVFGIGFGILI